MKDVQRFRFSKCESQPCIFDLFYLEPVVFLEFSIFFRDFRTPPSGPLPGSPSFAPAVYGPLAVVSNSKRDICFRGRSTHPEPSNKFWVIITRLHHFKMKLKFDGLFGLPEKPIAVVFISRRFCRFWPYLKVRSRASFANWRLSV